MVGWRPGQGVQIVTAFTIMVFISIGFVYKHSDWVPMSLRGLQKVYRIHWTKANSH